MLIREEHGDRRCYLPLLLLADEQESMVDRYLDEGAMYVLEVDGIVVGECVVNDAGDGVLEIKNIAVDPPPPAPGLWPHAHRFRGQAPCGRV